MPLILLIILRFPSLLHALKEQRTHSLSALRGGCRLSKVFGLRSECLREQIRWVRQTVLGFDNSWYRQGISPWIIVCSAPSSLQILRALTETSTAVQTSATTAILTTLWLFLFTFRLCFRPYSVRVDILSGLARRYWLIKGCHFLRLLQLLFRIRTCLVLVEADLLHTYDFVLSLFTQIESALQIWIFSGLLGDER